MPKQDPRVTAVSAADAAPKKKRKSQPKEDEGGDDDDDDSGSDNGSDVSMINVDFDFFNLNPDVDQIATKRLLRQHLSHDEENVDVHPLAELILSEAVRQGAGSSIKTDGEESDPWALLAAVDVGRHRDHQAFKPFLTYLESRLPSSSKIRPHLSADANANASVSTALIFSLRMLNLPLPLLPPMYKMLLSELSATPPDFQNFLIWGRGYRLEGTEEGMGLDMDQPQGAGGGKKKKSKNTGTTSAPGLAKGSFPYHPEEDIIDQLATIVETYPFKTAPKRDEDAFGVEQFGRLVLIEKSKLVQAIQQMEAAAGQ